MAPKPNASSSSAAAAPLPEEGVSAMVKVRLAARRGRKAEASEPLPKRSPAAGAKPGFAARPMTPSA